MVGNGFAKESELGVTYYTIDLLKKLGQPDNSSSLREWLYRRGHSDGGFSDKGQSDLIDTYYALQIMQIMQIIKMIPGNLSAINQFITSHKVSKGGFVFITGSNEPSIEATFFGCESERILNELKKHRF